MYFKFFNLKLKFELSYKNSEKDIKLLKMFYILANLNL